MSGEKKSSSGLLIMFIIAAILFCLMRVNSNKEFMCELRGEVYNAQFDGCVPKEGK